MRAKQATAVDTHIAKLVRMHRLRMGLSQAQLAEALGITFQQIQKYEKGANRICAGRLFEIAQLLQIPIEALFPRAEMDRDPSGSGRKNDAVMDALLTADGLRLCSAFLRIDNPNLRRKIIAFVEDVGGSGAGDDIAPIIAETSKH